MGFDFNTNNISPVSTGGGGGGGTGVINSLNVTPTTSKQTFNASDVDGYKPVKVAAVTAAIDENIVASNIVSGKSILGVNGSAVELNGETQSVALTSSAGNTFTPTTGKNGITSITVTPTNEARTVNPSTSSQSLTVNTGYSGNGTITVNPVTSSIDANIVAGNIKKDVTILSVTGTYEGATLITKTITQNGIYNASSDNADGYSSVTVNVGGIPTGKYQLFDRIKDDSNINVGTVCGFFKDANDVEYAVVCLDYIFRASYNDNLKFFSSSTTTITDLPLYDGNGDYIKLITNVYTNTATYNCDKLKAYCTSSGNTSTALDWCRHFYFTIDNVTYYGQIPNTYELFQIALNHERLGALDPTDLDDYNKSLIKLPGRNIMGSDLGDRRGRISTLYQSGVVNNNGNIADNLPVYPVLEIPNALS